MSLTFPPRPIFSDSTTMLYASFSVLLVGFLCQTLHTSANAIAKRATCTVTGSNDAGISDVPAINSAFTTCGNGGIIKFSAGTTYNIRDVVTISNCKNCEVQVEGTLKSSDDLTFWNGTTGYGLIVYYDNVSLT